MAGSCLFCEFLGFHFGFTPSREALLLRSIMRTRFQIVGFAGVAVEMNYLELIHGVSPSEIAVAAWLSRRVMQKRPPVRTLQHPATASLKMSSFLRLLKRN